jgi:hypothetical protein
MSLIPLIKGVGFDSFLISSGNFLHDVIFFCKNLRATELCNVLYLIRTQIWSAFRNVSCVTHRSKGYRKVQGSD